MTDLEICKRIAEVENLKTSVTDDEKGVWANIYPDDCYNWFNPLTDDALCFQLMIKYKVDVQHYTDKGYTECTMWEYQGNFFVDEISRVSDKSTNKAICLAIIEAHNQ